VNPSPDGLGDGAGVTSGSGNPWLRFAPRIILLVAGFLLGAGVLRDSLPQDPGGGPFTEDVVVPVLVSLVVVTVGGVLTSFKWERAGVATATFGACYVVVVTALHYELGVSLVVLAAFALPIGLLWREQVIEVPGRRTAVLGITTVALTAVAGLVSHRIWSHFLGPTHPESGTARAPDSPVRWVWAGAVETDRFSLAAVLNEVSTDLELIVTDSRGVEVQHTAPRAAEAGTPLKIDVVGLEPATEYRYVLASAGEPDDLRSGRVRTFPDGPASLTLAFASCARNKSNAAVFDTIRELDADLYANIGDIHYRDIVDDDPRQFAAAYDQIHASPARSALYRSTAFAYVWDDHDYGADDSDSTSRSRPAAWSTYRQFVPHYELAIREAGSINQAFTIGRVRVVMLDTRSERLASEATMLGSEQLGWLFDQLLTARDTHALVILVSPTPWIAAADPGADHWGGFPAERDAIGTFLEANDIDNIVLVAGDAHMVAIDDGTNSGYGGHGGFPVLQAAALDRPGALKGGPYSHGAFPGGGQFGVVEIADDGGDQIDVELIGMNWEGEVLTSLSTRFSVG
jgi:hypothetical protein